MIDEHLADDDYDEAPGVGRSWQPRPWWAWHVGVLVAGVVVLLLAGTTLAGAEFGTSLRARACDASPLLGLALLATGAFLVVVGMQLARLQHELAVLGIDLRSTVFAAPVPVLLLAATLPGVMGCAVGQDIAAFALVGDALVGAPGLTLAGAAAALLGAAIAAALHVTWQTTVGALADESPGIVELAMREAEALETDQAAQRFHGVD